MFIGLSHEKMIEKSQPFEEKLFISKAIQKSTFGMGKQSTPFNDRNGASLATEKSPSHPVGPEELLKLS